MLAAHLDVPLELGCIIPVEPALLEDLIGWVADGERRSSLDLSPLLLHN